MYSYSRRCEPGRCALRHGTALNSLDQESFGIFPKEHSNSMHLKSSILKAEKRNLSRGNLIQLAVIWLLQMLFERADDCFLSMWHFRARHLIPFD